MTLIKTSDISSYFVREDNKWIFVGKKLEIFVPKLYQDRGLLVLGDVASCLGIFQMRIDDTFYSNVMILARLSIEFVSNHVVTEGDTQYMVLTLEHGSVFIANSRIVKDANIIYEIFVTFIALGKVPDSISYDSIQSLFDNDDAHCGVSLKVNHSVFEMIYAHMYRDAKDPYTFYRHTPMTAPPQIVSIRQISHGPISTSARITGSYLAEGMTASLVDDTVRTPSVVENLMRA